MVERSTNTLLFQIPVSYFKQVDRKEAPASAAWSSDGKWVYFSSSISGSWDIYRMRPDGSMIQNLTEDWPSDELMPAAR
jgi:Tol biopolymer transport system component